MRELEEVVLTVDEMESLRLFDILKKSQIEAALLMNIHQSTFQRILSRAREKVSQALVNGKALKIEGGNYNRTEETKMPNKDGNGPEGKGPKTGRGKGNCEGAVVRGRGPCGNGRGRRG